MRDKIFLLSLILLGSSLMASSRESLAIQEFRIELGELSRALSNQRSDFELLQNEIARISQEMDSSKKELLREGKAEIETAREKGISCEKRIDKLEAAQKSLITDLKTLKDHFNESSKTLSKCEDKLAELDKTLTSDMKGLKNTLQSMMALLQKGNSSDRVYIVQPGDSLGKIALDNHTTIRRLKEFNDLSSDQIYSGQKLNIPE